MTQSFKPSENIQLFWLGYFLGVIKSCADIVSIRWHLVVMIMMILY